MRGNLYRLRSAVNVMLNSPSDIIGGSFFKNQLDFALALIFNSVLIFNWRFDRFRVVFN